MGAAQCCDCENAGDVIMTNTRPFHPALSRIHVVWWKLRGCTSSHSERIELAEEGDTQYPILCTLIVMPRRTSALFKKSFEVRGSPRSVALYRPQVLRDISPRGFPPVSRSR